jgi:hypothetical protein
MQRLGTRSAELDELLLGRIVPPRQRRSDRTFALAAS